MFVTIGTGHTAFLSRSVKGGGRFARSSDVPFQLCSVPSEKTDNYFNGYSILHEVAFLGRITAFLARIGVFLVVYRCFSFGGFMFPDCRIIDSGAVEMLIS